MSRCVVKFSPPFLEVTLHACPESEKSAAVMRIPVPRAVHEIRRFLGMVGWYRRFTPKFPNISKPLNSRRENV